MPKISGQWGGVIFAALVTLALISYNLHEEREARRKNKETQNIQFELQSKFRQDIEQAKRETADPCNHNFYAVIQPPKGLNVGPRVIITGEDVTSFGPSVIHVRPVRDSVEFWVDFGSHIEPAQKIGEKKLGCQNKIIMPR